MRTQNTTTGAGNTTAAQIRTGGLAMSITKPMLASRCKSPDELRFPQFVGWREEWDMDAAPAIKPARKAPSVAPGKIIPFPVAFSPSACELDAGEPQNIVAVEFDRDEYIVTASPAAV